MLKKINLTLLQTFLSLFLILDSFPYSIDAFFNTPPSGDNIKNIIISFIDQSKDNISISTYSFDDPDIINSLITASQRGVKIRITIDSDYWNSIIDYLDSYPNIEVINDLKSKGYKKNSRQHHSKFLVIDYGIVNSPVKNTVITGSFNFTVSANNLQYNNIVIISDNVDVANMYIQEFNEEWGGPDFEFNYQNSRFGKQKTDPPPYIHHSDNFEVYFSYSPINKIANKIYNLIENASNAFICMYSFSTNSILFDLIYQTLDTKNIYGIFDKSQAYNSFSAFNYLVDKKPNNFAISTEYKILHNKYIVLNYDENNLENSVVITGSYNLSKNAEENNEENIIVIKGIPNISKKYMKDFIYHFTKSNKEIPIFSIPFFEKTNITCSILSTNTILGKNLNRIVSIFASNENNYLSLNILSNYTNRIFFIAPNIPGVFKLISLLDNGDRDVIPVELIVFSSSEPFLIINKGEKFLTFGNPIDIKLYSQDSNPITYVKVIIENKEKFITLKKENGYFRNLIFLDTLESKVSNYTPIVFNYSNIFITNYIILPPFYYEIEKPNRIYRNSLITIRVNVNNAFGRSLRLSADANVPLKIKDDGSISLFTGNVDKIKIFLTIEDDIGNSYSEYLEFDVLESEEVIIYPSIVNKNEKIFIEGKFDKIEIFDKDYNKIPFKESEDEIGRKYIIPEVFKRSNLLFIVIYSKDKKFVKKVITK